MVPYDVDQIEWGAQKVFIDGELDGYWVVDKWVIHYGGGASPAAEPPYSQAKEEWALRIYEQSHLSRGWRAIGYNYAVGQTGLVYRLRGENPSGATSGDYDDDGIRENSEARAVLWIGGLGQEPSPAAYESMERLFAAEPHLVTVHSDHKNTGCPGDYWRQWADDYKQEVFMEFLKAQLHALVDSAFAVGGAEGNEEWWHTYIDELESTTPEDARLNFVDLFNELFTEDN